MPYTCQYRSAIASIAHWKMWFSLCILITIRWCFNVEIQYKILTYNIKKPIIFIHLTGTTYDKLRTETYYVNIWTAYYAYSSWFQLLYESYPLDISSTTYNLHSIFYIVSFLFIVKRHWFSSFLYTYILFILSSTGYTEHVSINVLAISINKSHLCYCACLMHKLLYYI
jgi:hypothetical protein